MIKELTQYNKTKLTIFESHLISIFLFITAGLFLLVKSFNVIALSYTVFILLLLFRHHIFKKFTKLSSTEKTFLYYLIAIIVIALLVGELDRMIAVTIFLIAALNKSLEKYILSGKYLRGNDGNNFVIGFMRRLVVYSTSTFTIISLFKLGNIYLEDLSLFYIILSSIIISSVFTAAKVIRTKGFFDFGSLLILAVLAFAFLRYQNQEILIGFSTGIILSGAVTAISFRLKFLTKNGSFAAFILAGFIFGIGGLKWSVPVFTFFILSSLLSKLRKNKNSLTDSYFEKNETRDEFQVMANGGIGLILVVINFFQPNSIYYLLYLSSLAAVCADTWATEIGNLNSAKTYNIVNFKQVEQGVSGGISLQGTIGALAGSMIIAISGIRWIHVPANFYFLIVAGAGLFGSFVDSILGASLQSQYSCTVCGKITERFVHCKTPAVLIKGFKWINNDIVNFAAGVSGCAFLFLIVESV